MTADVDVVGNMEPLNPNQEEGLCQLFAALKTNSVAKPWDDDDMEPQHQKRARMIAPAIGLWKSPQGEFRIESKFAGEIVEIKQECKCCGRKLRGALVQVGQWQEAEIREAAADNPVVGYVRLRMEGSGLRTQCKKALQDPWIADSVSVRSSGESENIAAI